MRKNKEIASRVVLCNGNLLSNCIAPTSLGFPLLCNKTWQNNPRINWQPHFTRMAPKLEWVEGWNWEKEGTNSWWCKSSPIGLISIESAAHPRLHWWAHHFSHALPIPCFNSSISNKQQQQAEAGALTPMDKASPKLNTFRETCKRELLLYNTKPCKGQCIRLAGSKPRVCNRPDWGSLLSMGHHHHRYCFWWVLQLCWHHHHLSWMERQTTPPSIILFLPKIFLVAFLGFLLHFFYCLCVSKNTEATAWPFLRKLRCYEGVGCCDRMLSRVVIQVYWYENSGRHSQSGY